MDDASLTGRAGRAADLAGLAVRAARAAGDLLLERFGGPVQGLGAKSSRTDLVSDADRDAEALILGMIRAARPGDRILAEETGAHAGELDGVTWNVDPLDGTVNYLWGNPHWSVSIHAADADGDLTGVVLDPCRGELFQCVGDVATMNGAPLRIPPLDDPADALVATGFSYDAALRPPQLALLATALPVVRDVRRAGSAALDLAWLAAGRLDAYWEFGLNAWDWAAGAMLVRGAGGEVAALDDPVMGPGLVAGRAGVVAPLRSLLGI